MAKVQEYYNIGNVEDMSMEKLLNIMQDMYRDLAIAINRKPDVYSRTTDGSTSDTLLSDGDININSSTRKIEMLSTHDTTTTVTWTTIS